MNTSIKFYHKVIFLCLLYFSCSVFAGGFNGTVYKCLARQTNFTPMTGTSGEIMILLIDSNNNVYTGGDNGIIYKSNGKDPFTKK